MSSGCAKLTQKVVATFQQAPAGALTILSHWMCVINALSHAQTPAAMAAAWALVRLGSEKLAKRSGAELPTKRSRTELACSGSFAAD